ncbi:hypothetical protein IVA80_20680 [Bradyrhizobium sp. 139]|uniref:hypothetical protein n=1 Tax=Bradyrhizobium sp. 139 TaxID=2782616 RepID=UPI001FF9432F|nr:hypothetical protein [Bradyrhizobium sp. 139]MCK1743206.1 hypothetical protein [Bradyrhizobium sp. 139]
MGVVVCGAFAVDNPFRVQLEKSTIPTFLSDELWIIEEAWRGGVDTNALKRLSNWPLHTAEAPSIFLRLSSPIARPPKKHPREIFLQRIASAARSIGTFAYKLHLQRSSWQRSEQPEVGLADPVVLGASPCGPACRLR